YFANPSSIHKAGADVEKLQTAARNQAAQLLDVKPKEIIFTSGGTEGNNLAIKGTALQYQQRGKHIITTEIEHASVYETVKSLEQFGFEVTLLSVDQDGHVKLEDLKNLYGMILYLFLLCVLIMKLVRFNLLKRSESCLGITLDNNSLLSLKGKWKSGNLH